MIAIQRLLPLSSLQWALKEPECVPSAWFISRVLLFLKGNLRAKGRGRKQGNLQADEVRRGKLVISSLRGTSKWSPDRSRWFWPAKTNPGPISDRFFILVRRPEAEPRLKRVDTPLCCLSPWLDRSSNGYARPGLKFTLKNSLFIRPFEYGPTFSRQFSKYCLRNKTESDNTSLRFLSQHRNSSLGCTTISSCEKCDPKLDEYS